MRCRVPEEDLSALLDGELDVHEERLLRDHLGACAACRTSLAGVERVSVTLRASGRAELVPPSQEFVARVTRAAASAPPRSRSHRARLRSRPVLSLAPVAVAASVLLLVGLTALAILEGATPAPVGVSIAEGPSGAREPLAELPSGVFESPVFPVARDLPALDLGAPLPPPSVSPEPRILEGEDLYLALGLRKMGGSWMSEEAYRRFREHREQQAFLALTREKNEARPGRAVEPPLQPGPGSGGAVRARLASLDLADPVRSGDLTIVPLLSHGRPFGIDVYGLSEGLDRSLLTIREEMSTATLFALNNDPERYAFLAAGEILVGGQQDRIITRDTLIPPEKKIRLPVLCCEHGRSTGPTNRFVESPGLAPAGLRGLLLGARDQGAIWEQIASDLAELGAGSETDALRSLFAPGRSGGFTSHLAKLLPALEGRRVVGFVALAGDQVIGAEVFASHGLLAVQAERFVTSYLLEASKKEPAVAQSLSAAGDLKKLLEGVGKADFFPARVSASGRETVFDGGKGNLSGYAVALVEGGDPVHVSLLAGISAGPTRRSSQKTVSPGEQLPPGAPPGGEVRRNGGEPGGAERRRRERRKLQGIPPDQMTPGNSVEPPRRDPVRTPPKPPKSPGRVKPPDRNDPPKINDRR